MLIWLVVFTHLVTSSASAPPPEWVRHARQLIGENQGTRDQAIGALNKTFPNIESLLPELAGGYRNYALDAAVALKMPGSVQKLLPMVADDRDGSITLAINALMDEKTQRIIAGYYLKFLEKRPLHAVPVPVLMAMVDYLTHLRLKCEEVLFGNLITHPRLEVQQAAALHFAVLNNKRLTRIIKKNFRQLYPQVRAQILLTFLDQKDLAQAKKICGADEDPIVRSACQSLPLKEKRDGRKNKRK